ncbi:MAG: LamG-like jellyroll fold domain-containing protein [Candidatus Jorgensenbacteria bacterium]
MNHGNRGFTLIELMVAFGILIIVSSVGFISLSRYKGGQDIELSMEEITSVIRDVQKRSITEQDGKQWGIRFDNANSSYKIWSGSSYASGTVDRLYSLKRNIVFGNPSTSTADIIFSAISGKLSEPRILSLLNTKRDGIVGDIVMTERGTVTSRLEHGLVGYWHFDEAANTSIYDTSGFGNTGSASGTSWSTVSDCKAGSCLSFSASTQNVSITDQGSLDPQTTLTLTAWVYPTSVGGSDSESTIIWGASPPAYYLSFNDSTLALDCYWYGTTPAGYHTTSAASVPLNKWSQVTCVWDGTNNIRYINGTSAGTTAVTGTGLSPTAVVIGAENSTRQFVGKIDEVRIYNRALSATEILNLYDDLK